MTTLLVATAVASLAGSLHCVGMCGGFVAFYAGASVVAPGRHARGRWLAHVVYNGARLLVYGTMGLLAGALGAALDLAGRSVHLQRVAAPLAGGVMVLWGLATLLPLIGVRLRLPKPFLRLSQPLGRAMGVLREQHPVLRAGAVGALTTLLPCGWLYAFVVAAAGTGSAVKGAAVMFAFWLGTLPVLLGLGVGAQRLSRLLGRFVPALTASVVLLLGVWALVGRLSMPAGGHGMSAMPPRHAAPLDQVQLIQGGQSKPPCHR